MNEDFNKKIKTILESNDLKDLVDTNLNSLKNINHCCSNSSFVFVYCEDKSQFIAININRITKSPDAFEKSVQILNLTAAPIGHVKKVLINPNGTHILLVYDKSLSAVELPLKWGKFDEYECGNKSIICKTIQFHLKNLNQIVDAQWHSQPDDHLIVCLAHMSNTYVMQFFSILNSAIAIKSFSLTNTSNQPLLSAKAKPGLTAAQASDSENFIAIEVGGGLEFNDKHAYPIFALKSNGKVDCLIEYENSTDYDYLGTLRIKYSCIDYEEVQQVISFLCVGSQPNCIVLLLKSGQIFHCLFFPTTNVNTEAFESTEFYEVNSGESNSEASLFAYEIIEIDSQEVDTSTVLLKDSTDPFRYQIYHKAGVHSVFLPWLEEAKLTLSNMDRFDADDYNESKVAVISNLICTMPIENGNDKSSIAGVTLINGFGARTILLALTNELRFICAHIYKSEQFDCSMFQRSMTESRLNASSASEIDPDRFLNYIKSILKRDITIPVIKSDSGGNSTQKDNNEFITKVINSMKSEYLEKQKKAFNEIYEKAKQLKQQNKVEEEKIKEISTHIDELDKNKHSLIRKYVDLDKKQHYLVRRYEELWNRLQTNMSCITDHERTMKKELTTIQSSLDTYDRQIQNAKSRLDKQEEKGLATGENKAEYKEGELKQIKELINNENDRLKDLMQKVEKLHIAVKM